MSFCSHSCLREILERYNYQLPHLADQTINEKIKIVGERAGITEPVEIVTTKGGSPVRETFPKNEFINICFLINHH